MRKKVLRTAGFLLPVLWLVAGTFAGFGFAKDSPKTVPAFYLSSAGERLTARFDIKARKVTVERPGKKTRILPLAVSASGARYSDGTMTFWEHQGTATLFRGDEIVFYGKETTAVPENPAARKKHKRQRAKE